MSQNSHPFTALEQGLCSRTRTVYQRSSRCGGISRFVRARDGIFGENDAVPPNERHTDGEEVEFLYIPTQLFGVAPLSWRCHQHRACADGPSHANPVSVHARCLHPMWADVGSFVNSVLVYALAVPSLCVTLHIVPIESTAHWKPHWVLSHFYCG